MRYTPRRISAGLAALVLSANVLAGCVSNAARHDPTRRGPYVRSHEVQKDVLLEGVHPGGDGLYEPVEPLPPAESGLLEPVEPIAASSPKVADPAYDGKEPAKDGYKSPTGNDGSPAKGPNGKQGEYTPGIQKLLDEGWLIWQGWKQVERKGAPIENDCDCNVQLGSPQIEGKNYRNLKSDCDGTKEAQVAVPDERKVDRDAYEFGVGIRDIPLKPSVVVGRDSAEKLYVLVKGNGANLFANDNLIQRAELEQRVGDIYQVAAVNSDGHILGSFKLEAYFTPNNADQRLPTAANDNPRGGKPDCPPIAKGGELVPCPANDYVPAEKPAEPSPGEPTPASQPPVLDQPAAPSGETPATPAASTPPSNGQPPESSEPVYSSTPAPFEGKKHIVSLNYAKFKADRVGAHVDHDGNFVADIAATPYESRIDGFSDISKNFLFEWSSLKQAQSEFGQYRSSDLTWRLMNGNLSAPADEIAGLPADEVSVFSGTVDYKRKHNLKGGIAYGGSVNVVDTSYRDARDGSEVIFMGEVCPAAGSLADGLYADVCAAVMHKQASGNGPFAYSGWLAGGTGELRFNWMDEYERAGLFKVEAGYFVELGERAGVNFAHEASADGGPQGDLWFAGVGLGKDLGKFGGVNLGVRYGKNDLATPIGKFKLDNGRVVGGWRITF